MTEQKKRDDKFYYPFDGDFDKQHSDRLTMLARDVFGNRFYDAVEVHLSWQGDKLKAFAIGTVERDDDIRILDIPSNWTHDEVKRIVDPDWYGVYFKPFCYQEITD